MTDRIKAVIREVGKITVAVGGRDTTPAKWMGKWQPEERYGVLHKVEHLGSSYVCIKACVGVDPEADVTLGDGVEGQYWILIAKKGKDGRDGNDFTYDMFTEEQLEALKGKDGYTPTVEATQTAEGADLLITNYDKNTGTESADLVKLKNGKNGDPGKPGAKGDSSYVRATETEDGVELHITNTIYDSDGSTTVETEVVKIKNGEPDEESVGAAAEYAAAAKASADAAAEAKTAAENAKSLATSAKNTATSAASQAEQAASRASSTVNEASSYANNASKSATAAKNSENNARTFANNASSSKTAAASSATTAQDAANEAKGYRDEVAEMLENAGGAGGKAVQSDWNQGDARQPDYIKNKPFGTEVTPAVAIEWDGSTEGKETVEGAPGVYLCKVSDTVVPIDALYGATVSGIYEGQTFTETVPDGNIVNGMEQGLPLYGVITPVGNMFAYCVQEAFSLGGAPLSPGVYLMYLDTGDRVSALNTVEVTKVTKIPAEYLPDDLPGSSGECTCVYVGEGEMPEGYNIQIIPNGEAVKLLPTVTADDNGKFLRVVNGEWAAVTLPNAEGGSF